MNEISEYNGSVAKNAKRIIDEVGLKQSVVAGRAGFSIQEFNAMLNGRRIMKAVEIQAIADVLNVTPNELFGVKKKEGG